MSWLNDIERDFKYECSSCGETTILKLKSGDPAHRQPKPCACGSEAQYAGFLPIQMSLRGKVAYDQNGRKAYAISDGRGGVRYVSATKMHYLETGDIKPQYTRAYEEHLKKSGKTELMEETKHGTLVEQRKKTQERAKAMKEQLKTSTNTDAV